MNAIVSVVGGWRGVRETARERGERRGGKGRGARCEVRAFGCGGPKWTDLSLRGAATNQELQREVMDEDDVDEEDVLVLFFLPDGRSRKRAGAGAGEAGGVRA